MKAYDDDFQWNDFFQFVLFFSLAPMPAIAYGIKYHIYLIVTLIILRESTKNYITFEDITIITNKMRKSDLLDTYVAALFEKYAYIMIITILLNRRNHYLSFSQFFPFFDQTYELWEELFSFRMKMLSTFFPNFSYRKILTRKRNILYIKQYKVEHNKFPSSDLTFCDRIISFILNRPNTNRYDYDLQYYPNFSYHDFVRDLVRKYIPNFNNYKVHFKMKFLSNSTGNPSVNEIDEMYMQFKQKRRTDNNSNNSSLLSRDTSSFSSSRENVEHSSVRSILRNSSNLRYNISNKRTKFSVQNPPTTATLPIMSDTGYFSYASIHKLS